MAQLELTYDLPAAPARVWTALTDPGAVAKWFWPANFGTQVHIDARVGGAYRIASDIAGIAVGGSYREIEAPRRLGFTWLWDGDDEETEVAIGLSARDGGSALALRHTGFAANADRNNHIKGWMDCLERLRDHVAEAGD
ncbi:MAG TPA: SRPBCC domain-containing protein [Stackebrandtia sp.]|jgi:uncharacterized protein YndB with AHSA1/START domain|uniref:SRPBCC family protein n=1 Tax=Stackebrandtia sp. TaxID=2023065 RepID=UPI002D58DA5E|nr:SRPBCC domain-containing protein [Stackebrandtia sp.]HZE41381.1 SRPBCC domain-containing protein [Stackebrandtia sp.]